MLTTTSAIALAFGLFLLMKLASSLYMRYTSPILKLKGPPSKHWLFGSFKDMFDTNNSPAQIQWVKDYGSTFKYWDIFNSPKLVTTDPRAINHILTRSYEYQKPLVATRLLARVIGKGVLLVEGDQHKQQRKVMNPAFGPIQIRALTEIFVEKSIQLRSLWLSNISKESEANNAAVIDAYAGLSKMTLDVIGLAGFNYDFDSLNLDERPNDLNDAFKAVVNSTTRFSMKSIIPAVFPVLARIPTEETRIVERVRGQMDRISEQLLRDSQKAVAAGDAKEVIRGRDLLSLLVRSNTSPDIPQQMRLSDADVMAQIPTFLIAGHETTSTATAWALFALTQAPHIQTKLRQELLLMDLENPSMDDLSSLPYLDMVVKEVLRKHSPVPASSRVAQHDDILPFEYPFEDKYGKSHDSLRIRKGDTIVMPIIAINQAKAIWGEDAEDFRPERWEKIPVESQKTPSVWGNQFTFMAGPRACIGWRFSIIEMKALLFVLVRAFEFELAVPADTLWSKQTVVQRPIVSTDLDAGHQLPLRIRIYQK